MMDVATKSSKRKRTEAEWVRYVEMWESSGDSQPDFCRRHHLRLGTFVYWRTKCLEKQRVAQAASFTAVQVKTAATPAAMIEIRLPNGVCVRIDSKIDTDTLRTLLTQLGIKPC